MAIAVVTGASAGVGRATARALAKRGYDVGLIARGVDGLAAARDEIQKMGRRALFAEVDVADAEAMLAAADRIERELGEIDVWVNNAMTSVFAPFIEMTLAEFKRVTEVTYLGVVNGTYAALRKMKPRKRGQIVQVGSALAYRSIPLQSAYCGAKAGIRGFTDSLRCEEHDIHLSMVQMPALNTPQFGWVRSKLPHKAQPVPPIFQPEVAARAIVNAIVHHTREVYVGWPTYKAIVFGAKLFPHFGDWYLAKTGFKAQQLPEPRDTSAPDNLFHPVPGDHGAHGTFDARAHARSFFSRVWVLAIGAAVILAGCLMLLKA